MKKIRHSNPSDEHFKDEPNNILQYFEKVAAKARRIVKKHGLKPDVIEEAIEWARKQK